MEGNESRSSITVHDKLDVVIVQYLRDSLSEFNQSHAGHDSHNDLLVVLRDTGNQMIGGFIGGTYYGDLHVDCLWVNEGQRRQGHSELLLQTAEREAIKRGCSYAHLDTHGFQAIEFYQKRGYTVVGELKDLPPGDSRYLPRRILKP